MNNDWLIHRTQEALVNNDLLIHRTQETLVNAVSSNHRTQESLHVLSRMNKQQVLHRYSYLNRNDDKE